MMEPEHLEVFRNLDAIIPAIRKFAMRRGRYCEELTRMLDDWSRTWDQMDETDQGVVQHEVAEIFKEIRDHDGDISVSLNKIHNLIDALELLGQDLTTYSFQVGTSEQAHQKFVDVVAHSPKPQKRWN